MSLRATAIIIGRLAEAQSWLFGVYRQGHLLVPRYFFLVAAAFFAEREREAAERFEAVL